MAVTLFLQLLHFGPAVVVELDQQELMQHLLVEEVPVEPEQHQQFQVYQ